MSPCDVIARWYVQKWERANTKELVDAPAQVPVPTHPAPESNKVHPSARPGPTSNLGAGSYRLDRRQAVLSSAQPLDHDHLCKQGVEVVGAESQAHPPSLAFAFASAV